MAYAGGGDSLLKSRSRRYLRNEAPCVSSRPTYSSRWKKVTLSHGIDGTLMSAARNSNWEAPVATMTRAAPFFSTMVNILLATKVAAARPTCCLSGRTRTLTASDARRREK